MKIEEINALLPIVSQRVSKIDPCTIDQARSICVDLAGSDSGGGELFMCARVMGHLIEYNESGDMVAARRQK
jgi:hypothetical protein